MNARRKPRRPITSARLAASILSLAMMAGNAAAFSESTDFNLGTSALLLARNGCYLAVGLNLRTIQLRK
jgi:hypothetical protein